MRARAVQCITVLGADGAAAADTDGSAALLAAHWGAILAEPARPDDGAVRRLLAPARLLDSDVDLVPLTFHEFVTMVGCTRHSAPGPDGVPYDAWQVETAGCGDLGCLTLQLQGAYVLNPSLILPRNSSRRP